MSLRSKMEKIYLVDRGIGSGAQWTDQLIDAVGSEGTLLDLGCGEGHLRRKLLPGATYVGLDLHVGTGAKEYSGWNIRPGVVGDAHQLPIADCSVSVAAALSVLEHLSRPQKAMSEVYRVLKQGGYFFVDVPFLHQIHHAPEDYFRYTPYSLREMAESAGFDVVEIRPSGGYARLIAYALKQAPAMIAAPGVLAAMVRTLICWPLAALGFCVGKLQYIIDMHDTRQELVRGYHAIFRKTKND